MDGAGKTYLIDRLQAEFPDLALVRNELGPDQEFDRWWVDVLRADEPTLHDRFFYSELVYGPVLRGSLKADLTLIDSVRSFIQSCALLIYCRPPVGVLLKRLAEHRAQMAGVRSNWRELLDTYDHLMEVERYAYPNGRFIYYLSTGGEAEIAEVIESVRKYLE
jgi:thymidylate kinase